MSCGFNHAAGVGTLLSVSLVIAVVTSATRLCSFNYLSYNRSVNICVLYFLIRGNYRNNWQKLIIIKRFKNIYYYIIINNK